ncbi:unnamed protein product [Tilletia controversa]|uniref:Uncharacterized protein n=1 Tax=Tilletia controversa TaxID=13291 RepID=A0A8X7N273_9BASI|nr:hypothetical protein CF328_g13 [Tilletia controversa]KAE8256106.1 hypothetical protein A4X06_0g72 [Tilletia controversa]CAD6930568.1 unnamed protein product [Tilletia controversa]
MPLHSFLPPYPATRGERVFNYSRSHTLSQQPSANSHARPASATQIPLRLQHLRKVFDILHLSLLRGDGPRAARALRLLVRSKEWRHAELWRYGLAVAGLLARDASLEGTTTTNGGRDDSSEHAESSTSRQVQLKQAEEAATNRRLAYLRGLYRAKPALRSEVLVDIVYELIELKRYDEAMREIEYVLDSHPFRNNPSLHLLAGILTLESGSQAHGFPRAHASSPSALAELPSAVRRAAEHHFRRTLTATRKDEADKQYAAQARMVVKKRRDETVRTQRKAGLEIGLEKQRISRAKREETLLGQEYTATSTEKPPSSRSVSENARQRRISRMERKYAGPHKWAMTLAQTDEIPESDVDEEEERASQHSALSDVEDSDGSGENGPGAGTTHGDDADEDVDMVDIDRVPQDVNPDEDDDGDGETPRRLPSAFAAAAHLLEGWTKSEASRRPSTWEAQAAQSYLDVIQADTS